MADDLAPKHSKQWHTIARAISDSPDTDIVEKESRKRRKDISVISEQEFRARLPAGLTMPEQLAREDWAVWRGGAAAICDAEYQGCLAEADGPGAIAMMETAILLLCDVHEVDEEVRTRLTELVAFCNKCAVKSMETGKQGHALSKKLLGRALRLTALSMATLLPSQDARLRLRATTLNNLGCLCRRKGKAHVALKHLEMALKIESEIVGPLDDPASTHLNLCAILSGLRQHKVAMKHARTAIDKILTKVGVAEDALDAIPKEATSHARNLMIGYHNMSCCHEASQDLWAGAKALDNLERAIVIGEAFFRSDPILKSMASHRKALIKRAAAAQVQAVPAPPPPMKEDETRAAGSVATARSSRRSARHTGRSHRSHKHSGRGQQMEQFDDGASSSTLPSIARSKAGERPVDFVPIKPQRPNGPKKIRPAYNFQNRRTGVTYDVRTGATTVPLGRRRGPARRQYARQPQPQHAIIYEGGSGGGGSQMGDEELAWHQQLGQAGPPLPNQRLLTTMELDMVHDLRPMMRRGGADAIDEDELGETTELEKASAAAGENGIPRLPQISGATAGAEPPAPKDSETEARETFESLAQGKKFLHRAALKEVLVGAYRSAHNSSSRQAKSVVEKLLKKMVLDAESADMVRDRMDADAKQDALERKEKGEATEQEQEGVEVVSHVDNQLHIVFEEFHAGWYAWQSEISVGGAAAVNQALANERAAAAASAALLGPKVHRAVQEVEYGGARHTQFFPQF